MKTSIVGRRIKERRKAVGLSADALGDILDKDRATIYRYEKDEIDNFPVSIIGPLAEVLQTSPAYLMGWTDDPSPTTKRPAPKDEPKHEELIRLFSILPEDAQNQILGIVRTLAEAHKGDEGRLE